MNNEHAFREFEARGWDEAAEDYDGSDFVVAYTQPAGVALADAVGAARGLRILDVACGPGLASREALGRGAEVVGVDISEAMVAVASRNVPDGTFHQAPAEELPFADGSFDRAERA